MPNAADLREALGLADLTTPTGKAADKRTPEPTGAGALQRDLQRAFDEGRGSNALRPERPRQPQQAPAQIEVPEGFSRSVSSVSPLDVPAQNVTSTPSPIRVSPTFGQVEPAASVRTQPSVMPVEGTSGYSGSTSTPSAEPLAWQDDWEKSQAEKEGREARTTNYLGEEYDMDGAGGYLTEFDNQLGAIGNTPTNDAYMRNAIASGMLSDEDIRDLYGRMTGGKSYWEMLVNKWDPRRGQREYEVNKDSTGNSGVIDDGTSYDYAHMTADKMTGQQYRQYSMMGMGGLPYDEIDPEKVYNKRYEALKNNFIPFTPDDTSLAHMAASNLISFPGRLGSSIGNLRENLSDYDIDVNGRHVSGDEATRKAGPLIHQTEREIKKNPEKFLHDNEDSGMPLVRETMIPDVNGRPTYHYGIMTSAVRMPDGSVRVEFNDGSSVNTNSDENNEITIESTPIIAANARGLLPSNLESLNDIGKLQERVDEEGGTLLDYAPVLYLPEMVTDDGTHLNYNEVRGIYYDQTPEDDEGEEDDNIRYNFSGLPINNKPRRFNKEPFTLENGFGLQSFDLSDLGNNLFDWTVGSIPISLGGDLMSSSPTGYLSEAYALSNAATALSGVDPGTYDPETGSYDLIAGDYDDDGHYRYGVKGTDLKFDPRLSDETIASNVIGNALVPLTEQLAGNIGSDPFKNMLQKFGIVNKLPEYPTLRQFLADTLIDNIGEGIEEIVGNWFDEGTQYGISGFGANQAYDEHRNPMYDTSGHEIRDYNTPIGQRLMNIGRPFGNPTGSVEDAVNSFLGGAGVSGMMNLFNPFGGWWPGLTRAGQRSIDRRIASLEGSDVPQYEAPELNSRYRRAPEEFRNSFSDERPQYVE